MLKNIDPDRECVTTPEASKRSGLSKVYLAHLLKKGTLDGFQVGRDWLIYTDSLERFLEKPRKSGPKGPRKKKPEHENTDKASTENESDNS